MFCGRRCFSLTRYPYGGPPRVRTNSAPSSFPSEADGGDTITVSSGEDVENLDFSDFSELDDSFYEEEENDSDSDIEVIFEAGRAEAIVSQILTFIPVEHQLQVMDLLVELRSLHL